MHFWTCSPGSPSIYPRDSGFVFRCLNDISKDGGKISRGTIQTQTARPRYLFRLDCPVLILDAVPAIKGTTIQYIGYLPLTLKFKSFGALADGLLNPTQEPAPYCRPCDSLPQKPVPDGIRGARLDVPFRFGRRARTATPTTSYQSQT
jgi:hypothetical protein